MEILLTIDEMVATQTADRIKSGREEYYGECFDSEDARVIVKAQLGKVWDWGLEPCPHRANNAKYFKPRCACGKCWDELLKECDEG